MDKSYFKCMHVDKSKIIEKGWGHEVHIINNTMYCGKILHFNAGGEMSMHYHINKYDNV